MTQEHPNISLLKQLDLSNIAEASALFAEGFVWHFFNPHLLDIQGDYVGVNGLQAFFERLAALTDGTFQVEAIAAIPCGDELVVTHVKDRMLLEGQPSKLDAVVVWRIVGNRIAEAWDIPSVYTDHTEHLPIAA
ncbi:MAG: nuclear transport factor 2 family protein [Cyanobacteria bacterium P01_A01_bin.37]